MAQVVGYFQNDVTFTEGPFVIVERNGWRIEAEQKGCNCPILPDSSIYEIAERKFGLCGKTTYKSLAEKVCDALNQMVRDKKIVLRDGCWVAESQAA